MGRPGRGTSATSRLRKAGYTIDGEFDRTTWGEILEFLAIAGGVGLWTPYDLQAELADEFVQVYCTGELQLQDTLELLLGSCGVSATVAEGMLLVTRTPITGLLRLDPAVAKRLEGSAIFAILEGAMLSDRLTTLGGLLELDLGAPPDDEVGDFLLGATRLPEVRPATILALIQLELEGRYTWKASENGLRLVKR